MIIKSKTLYIIIKCVSQDYKEPPFISGREKHLVHPESGRAWCISGVTREALFLLISAIFKWKIYKGERKDWENIQDLLNKANCT